MKKIIYVLVLMLLVVMFLSGCKTSKTGMAGEDSSPTSSATPSPSTNYCEGPSYDGCDIDCICPSWRGFCTSDGVCKDWDCEYDSDCASNKVCNEDIHSCTDCKPSDLDNCDSDEVCNVGGACVECNVPSDCGEDVCDEDGTTLQMAICISLDYTCGIYMHDCTFGGSLPDATCIENNKCESPNPSPEQSPNPPPS